MASEIVYTARALSDLNGIWEYISRSLKNPRAADETVSKIRRSISLLKTSPEMGTKLIRLYPEESPYRFLVSGKYMIFYWNTKQKIYIARVLYGKRNYLRLLAGEPR